MASTSEKKLFENKLDFEGIERHANKPAEVGSDSKKLDFEKIEKYINNPLAGELDFDKIEKFASSSEEESKIIIPSDEEMFYYGNMPGNEKKKGFWQILKERHEEIQKEFPWYTEKPIRNTAKILVYSWLDKFAEHKQFPGDGMFSDIANGILDGYKIQWAEYGTIAFNTFPKLRAHLSFAEGATMLDSVYTVSHNGKEYPIYLRTMNNKGQPNPLPEAAELQENINCVLINSISRYDKMGESSDETGLGLNRYDSSTFINEDFLSHSVNLVTNNDYRKFFQNEPKKANRWLTKIESLMVYTANKRNTQKEADVNALVSGANIKVYDKPVGKDGLLYKAGKWLMKDESPRSGYMWKNWAAISAMYTVQDIMFAPIEAILESRKVPENKIRKVADRKFKKTMETWMRFYNLDPDPANTPFGYSLD